MNTNVDKYKNFIIETNDLFSDCCEMRDLLAKVVFKKSCNKKTFLSDVLNNNYISTTEKKNILDFAYTQKYINLSELEKCNVFHTIKL